MKFQNMALIKRLSIRKLYQRDVKGEPSVSGKQSTTKERTGSVSDGAPKRKKSIYVVNAKDDTPPNLEDTIPLNCYEREVDLNLYITKTTCVEDDMFYEFPTKELDITDVVFFINNRYQRRNAVYEEDANIIYLTLNEYMKRQAMMEWNF